MIKKVTVTNYRGDSIVLDLARPDLSGFVVGSITGLGPGKATINTTEMSTNDGALYNSARVNSRNIVLTLLYLWKDSIEDARQLSYKYFPIKKNVTLRFETDNRVAEISGYVESNEPTIFSSNSGSEISIICPYPYFYSADDGGTQTTMFSGLEPMLEFPFSNESLTEPLIEMSRILNRTDNVVYYEGDVEIGIVITIHAIGKATNITIYNTQTRESMHIDTTKIEQFTGAPLDVGDDIEISTVVGNKYAHLIREGKTINILNCMGKDIDWFRLAKGDNVFVYVAETGTLNLQFKIENRLVYEGI